MKLKTMKDRITYRDGENIIVFRLGKTLNKKIAEQSEKIVQTYTFSQAQFEYVYQCSKDNVKPVFKTFFSLDSANCGDCPFAKNETFNIKKIGTCYTHKVNQYSGFLSMLRSINNEFSTYADIPELDNDLHRQILNMCSKKYVRFGTYGEPTKIDFELVFDICENSAKNWTGYTHQYIRNAEYLNFFMASVHNSHQAEMVKERFKGRSFIASKNGDENGVVCPASNEAGFKSNCSKCGICSGIQGKGNKSVVILEH